MDLEREDLAAFISLWSRTFVPFGIVTSSTFKVLKALQELAGHGGVLTVPRLTDGDEPPPGVSER